MHILFVHEINWRRKVVYEIHDFPELLSLRGYEVTFMDFPEGERRQGLRALIDLKTETRFGLSRAHPGSKITLVTPGRVFPAPFDRAFASLTHVPVLWRLLSNKQVDVVVLYGVPTNGCQTICIARHFGVPVIYRAIDISHQIRETRLKPLIHAAEKYVCCHADAVSTHNEPLRQYCISLGADPLRTSIEYPGLDTVRFSPGPKDSALMARYGIAPDDRIILFMGTLFRFAGLDKLIELLAAVLRADPRYKLLLIGGGEYETELRCMAVSLGLERSVIFAGFIEYDALPAHLRLGDVAVNPFKRSLVTECALPGKVFQYLATGLPTVCTPLAGLQSVVRGEADGVIYQELGERFVASIEEVLADDLKRDRLCTAARLGVESRFKWERCVTDFESMIRRTFNRSFK